MSDADTLKRIAELERRIAHLELARQAADDPPPPPRQFSPSCPACGVHLDRTAGFSCPYSSCPSGLGRKYSF